MPWSNSQNWGRTTVMLPGPCPDLPARVLALSSAAVCPSTFPLASFGHLSLCLSCPHVPWQPAILTPPTSFSRPYVIVPSHVAVATCVGLRDNRKRRRARKQKRRGERRTKNDRRCTCWPGLPSPSPSVLSRPALLSPPAPVPSRPPVVVLYRKRDNWKRRRARRRKGEDREKDEKTEHVPFVPSCSPVWPAVLSPHALVPSRFALPVILDRKKENQKKEYAVK